MLTITLEDGSTRSLPPPEGLAGSNCGVPGVWRFAAAEPGPRLALTALIHGNEVCGAEALWQVLQSGPAPSRGRLTLVFCNLDAYRRLDDAGKEDRRCVDEDLNRVWGRLEDPTKVADTYELRRAREIWPWVQDADLLLDLHSMSSPAPALGLVGLASKNVAFARKVGFPSLLVRDAGHASGLRLIDRPPFGDANASPTAMLVECGQHFSQAAFNAAAEVVGRTLAVLNGEPRPASASTQSVIAITEAVTIQTDQFEFTRDWPNMSVVPTQGTLVAHDGGREVRTPHDDAYMVMPASARYRRKGLTAVRFGKREAG